MEGRVSVHFLSQIQNFMKTIGEAPLPQFSQGNVQMQDREDLYYNVNKIELWGL